MAGTLAAGRGWGCVTGSGFATQDREASEGVMAAPWSGGVNGEHKDTMWATYPFLFRDEGTWFSRLILK